MEKIIIIYLAENLPYAFPKKKWYQWNLENRIATMQLKSGQQDKLDVDMLLQIYEKCPDMVNLDEQMTVLLSERKENILAYYIHPAYIMDVYQALFFQCQKQMERQEHVIILDVDGEILPDILYALAENRNYFSVLTKHPERFEETLQKIEMDYGLVSMIFEDEKELTRYLKHMPAKGGVCMIAEETGTEVQNRGLTKKADRCGISSLLYSLPKGSLFIDLSKREIYHMQILQKRMPLEYASIPIFLDNMAKNRYNAVVNEGITFQVKNKKKQLLWRRKGK